MPRTVSTFIIEVEQTRDPAAPRGGNDARGAIAAFTKALGGNARAVTWEIHGGTIEDLD